MAMGNPGMAMGNPGMAMGNPGMAMGNPGMAMGHPGMAMGHPMMGVSSVTEWKGWYKQFGEKHGMKMALVVEHHMCRG
jgi:hypothetical protein